MDQKELSWHDRGRLWLRLGVRLILLLLGLWAAVRLGPPFISLFDPFRRGSALPHSLRCPQLTNILSHKQQRAIGSHHPGSDLLVILLQQLRRL